MDFGLDVVAHGTHGIHGKIRNWELEIEAGGAGGSAFNQCLL
jgi:hypothetical protein